MAQVQDLTVVLNAAQSPNVEERLKAEKHLADFEEQDYNSFALSLAAELATDGKAETNRQIAGLMLKNSLDARDYKKKVCTAPTGLSFNGGRGIESGAYKASIAFS